MKWLLILILCSSCIPTYYVSSERLSIYDRQSDTDMTEEQTERLFLTVFSHPAWMNILENAGIKHKWEEGDPDNFKYTWTRQIQLEFFRDLLEDWDFVFTSAWFTRPLKDLNKVLIVAGMTDTKDKVIYLRVTQKCYGDSGLGHEIGHVLRIKYGMGGDIEHKDTELWTILDILDLSVMKELCPKGYISNRRKPKEIIN